MPDITLLKASAYEALQTQITNGISAEQVERALRDGRLSLALRDAGVLPLTNVGGTGDAITAELLPASTNVGITTLSGVSAVEYVPIATNPNDNPSLTVGGTAYEIRDANGGNWPAGGFMVGRSYILRRRTTTLRVISGDVSRTDLADGRIYALMAASSPSAAVGIPQGTNLVASVHNGSGLIRYWRVSGAPSGGVETESVKMSADGRWWSLLSDAGISDLSAGRLYYLNAANSPSSAVVPATATMVVSVNIGEGLSREWRYRLAPADGLETENLVQSADGRWWERVKEAETLAVRTDLTAAVQQEIADRAADTAGIRNGDMLTDGGVAIIGVDGSGDILRLRSNGLDFVPCPETSDRVMRAGSVVPSAPDANDGVVIETLNGDPLRCLYPDGMDFVPSARLIERLGGGSGGGSGGGLTEDGWATAPDGSFTAQAGQHGIQAVDRFLIRGDGVRLPVPVVGGVQRRASIESSFGQSNANVTRLQDGLIWDTPPFPFHAVMLDDMNAFGSGTHRGGMMGWQGVAVARGTRFISASEALRATQDFSSAAFATRQRLAGSGLRRVGLIRSSAWGGNKLVGNAAGQGIWKDSNGAYTQAWINWQGDLLQSYQLLTAAGYLVDQVNINFVHQEADWQTPRATYLSDFIAMKGEIQTWIAANLPGVSVEWFVDQASGSGRRTPTYNGGAWPVRMSIHDASLPANGGNNITMVMPRYWLTFGSTMGGAQEDIHHSYRARIWQGEIYGYAQREKRAGRPWRCPVMSSASVNGNSVVVDFNSLLPLVIDPTFCKVRSDMGFVIGNGAAVTGVRQTGQRQITVDCATAPGTSISYAYRSVDGADVLDEWPIATGAIRDAWEAPSAFDPGKKLVRAALGYQLQL